MGSALARRGVPRLGNVTLRELRASRGPRRAVEYALARAYGWLRDLARGVSPALGDAAREAPSGVRVIADGPVAAAAIVPLARRREMVYLAHNLESSGFRGESERAGLARFEHEVLATFSELWMATRADERGAKALAGGEVATRYVPNVVDTDHITPVVPTGGDRLLFVGDLTYEPNLEALGFLADEVLPAVWEQRPDVRLTVVGRGLPGSPPDPRIEAPGFVEDLGAAYAAADVVVVPLQRGGGSPLKFIEALAYGLPVVATAHAARLIEDGVPGRDFLATETGAQFAAAILGLLGDCARGAALAKAGRELAVARYSVDALASLLG